MQAITSIYLSLIKSNSSIGVTDVVTSCFEFAYKRSKSLLGYTFISEGCYAGQPCLFYSMDV